jgi:hypothetical protein
MDTNRKFIGPGLWVVLTSLAWAQVTQRVSVSSAGRTGERTQLASRRSQRDGRLRRVQQRRPAISFRGTTNGSWDVFVRDLASGTTERISVDSSGAQADGGSDNAVESPPTDASWPFLQRCVATSSPGTRTAGRDAFVPRSAARHDGAGQASIRAGTQGDGDMPLSRDLRHRPVRGFREHRGQSRAGRDERPSADLPPRSSPGDDGDRQRRLERHPSRTPTAISPACPPMAGSCPS